MREEHKPAYVHAMAIAAMIEAMGMQAENQHRLNCGNAVAYGDEAFNALIEKYGIHHNALITTFQP